MQGVAPLNETLSPRRVLRAAIVTLVVGILTGGMIGLARAREPSPDVPAALALPVPHVGDRGEYRISVVSESAGSPNLVEPERKLSRFEWLADYRLRNVEGDLRQTNVLRSTEWSPSIGETPNESWVRYEQVIFLDAGTAEVIASNGRRWSHSNVEPGLAWERRENSSYMNLVYQHTGGIVVGTCGLRNAFQGMVLDPREPRGLFRNCSLSWFDLQGEWIGDSSPKFRAERTDRVGDYDAVVFAMQCRDGPCQRPVLVWLTPDLPYPLRVAVSREAGGTVFDVVQLERFTRGTTPIALSAEVPSAAPAPEFDFGPRQVWGPDDSGLDHPFPLSTAFSQAKDAPADSTLRDFFSAHPSAFVVAASYEESTKRGCGTHGWGTYVTRSWNLTATDGREAFWALSTAWTRPDRLPTDHVEGVPLCAEALSNTPTTTEYFAEFGRAPRDGLPPPDSLPSSMPTAASLLARWQAFADEPTASLGGNAWGFSFRYGDTPTIWRGTMGYNCVEGEEGCSRLHYFVHAGLRQDEAESGVIGIGPSQRVQRYHNVEFDPEGRPVRLSSNLAQSGQSMGLGNLFPSGDAREAATVAETISEGFWAAPTSRQIAATGAIAILAGLAYWSWPFLKSSLAWPLFSRIDQPRALAHPTRADMLALIRAEPGIHFEELRRRLGTRGSTTRHHLRKLVQTGLVAVQPNSRYACYFAHGAVDRRLMAAAPILKAESARAILQAASNEPGSSALDIARALGLSPATVTYHLARLRGAALVEAEREGKHLRVRATNLGRRAIAPAAAA